MAKRVSTPASPSQLKPAALRNFHGRLATWYGAHGRHDLPWRNTADPYRIWISEVMLQQTQVATVLARFYGPFLEKFPTVEDLAKAPREAVMKAWEGLGYYRRAGFLHEAAKEVVSRESLVFSKESAALPLTTLLSLPGIGRNTAHAIMAFAYHQPVAILEANVKRVVARVFALEHPSDAAVWAGAEQLLNRKMPFDYNQAMMDLGSMVCTPRSPNCDACPASGICTGKINPENYPAPKAKKQVPTREVVILVREDARGRLFLERRAEKLLGGLYGFAQSPHPEFALGQIQGEGHLGKVTHIYSHFKLIGHVWHEKIPSKPNAPDWHTRAEIAALPLSKLDHKVLALVENCHSTQKKRSKPKPAHRKH